MMERFCILALIGLPGAGKSTFCKWLTTMQQNRFNIAHFCFDDMFASFQNDFEIFDYKVQRIEFLKILEQLVNSFKLSKTLPTELLNKLKNIKIVESSDLLIICDDNNYYRSMRYKYYQFCRKNSLAYAQIYFEINPEICFLRNMQRTSKELVPQHIIEQMTKRLEVPDFEQHKWEYPTLTLKNVNIDYNVDSILFYIEEAFENIRITAEIESEETNTQPASIVHELDILLRRRLKEILNKETTAADKQAKALRLNAKRKEIMQMFTDPKVEYTVDNLKKFVDSLQ